MSEVPPEPGEEHGDGGAPLTEPPRPPGDPMPPVEPRDVPSGPFDRLFEELGVPPPPSPSDGSSWHAAWGPPQRPEPRGPSYAFPENRPLPRFDDTPFATIALPAPSDTPYRPGMYEPPVARPPERRSLVRPAGRLVRELAETIVLALAIFLLVRSVVQNFQVDGKSMEPTLETGWYLLVNKSLYWEVNLETVGKFVPFVEPGHDPTRYLFRGPKRGDVVVFRQPGQPIGATERDFIKRIIGLPGEIVEVHDGTVFINGRPLHEPYIADKPSYNCLPQLIPPGYYFVLGDNRNNSSDSHAWGPVPKGNIIGNAWVIYWPFHRVGLVNNKHEAPDKSQPETFQPIKQDVPLAKENLQCPTG